MQMENFAPIMFASLVLTMLIGFPVAFSLSFLGLACGFLAISLDWFPASFMANLPLNIFGILSNDLLLAIHGLGIDHTAGVVHHGLLLLVHWLLTTHHGLLVLGLMTLHHGLLHLLLGINNLGVSIVILSKEWLLINWHAHFRIFHNYNFLVRHPYIPFNYNLSLRV